MSTRGTVLFFALPCFLCFMSIGAGCPCALSGTAVMPRHMPAHIGSMSGPRMHGQPPAFAMHALNAPVRTRNNVVNGRVIQTRDKRVTIHGTAMLRPAHLAE